jgi:hypothetical protein
MIHDRRKSKGSLKRVWSPMTVCIAAIADRHEAIVSCVDTRVSTAITSFDPLVGGKMSGAKGWTALSSGTFSHAELLLDAFQAEMNGASDNNPPTVHRCLEAALQAELPKFSAAKYLTPYGLDMPGFLASRSKFTDERWNELSRLISEYSDYYDVEMIVSGWGAQQEVSSAAGACILSVDKGGVVPHSNVGFYACGSGKEIAHSILSFFNQQPHMTLAETIYHVAAAKFMSERTGGVGPVTLMRVAIRAGAAEDQWKGYFIQPDELHEIRELWLTHTAPKIPPEAEDKIVAILGKRGKLHVTQDHMVRRVQSSIEQTKQLGAQKSEPEH